MKPLIDLSAVEARDRMAKAEVTAEAYTRACLDQIAARDKDIEAWAHLDPAYALEQARGLHRLQVAATYRHSGDAWTGGVPSFAGARLARTVTRLRRREPLAICVTGDSISEGYNASAFVGAAPHQPAYSQLVASALEQRYGSCVTLRNMASAGWTSAEGRDAAAAVAQMRPDLVIVAYGMNDAGYMDADEFAANITGLVATVRRTVRDAEFVVVSTMLPHPAWHYPSGLRFPAYRDALEGLCGRGVALADVTTIWGDVSRRKHTHDLTGNGVNHPNDFGHRLYAQAILSLLIAP